MKRLQKILGTALLPIFLITNLSAAPHTPPKAAIAAADHLATQAGLTILKQGGNAFDAAVTVSSVLAVVEPMSSGIGGGGFWLLHTAKNHKNIMIDGRERAPLAASRDMYLDKKGQVIPKLSVNGPLAAGIPGEPAALAYLAEHYGKLSLKQDLAPAIKFAREGFPVNKRYQKLATMRMETIQKDPVSRNIFLQNFKVPEIGYVIKQPDLANLLEQLANKGWRGFYEGPIAKKLVAGVRAAGGIWSMKDLKDYHVKNREPLVGHYKNMKIISAPPPSAGGIALITMFNILSHYDLQKYDDITQKQLIVEAMRRAYWDRAKYLGDSDYVDVPINFLKTQTHANSLQSTITVGKATPSIQLGKTHKFKQDGDNTSHFSIIDKEGNRVAGTLSINYLFGAAFTVPGTGLLLNNEMDDFATKPGAPNLYGLVGSEANGIAPGKRPLSSMTPTFVETKDKVAILGTPGGSRIITMVLLAILDFAKGHSPSSWVALPRYHHQYLPDEIQFEKGGMNQKEQTQLKAMGYTLKELTRRYGDMQAILWDKSQNQVIPASDPRGEGST